MTTRITTRKTLKAAQAAILYQVIYQTAQLREMFSGTGSTNLDVINEFHEIKGMINALTIISGCDFSPELHRLRSAKEYALTNVTNINALRVVS